MQSVSRTQDIQCNPRQVHSFAQPTQRIARLTLNRPERASAQSYRLLYDLNAAYDRAVADDDVRVIVLAAAGKHFSSGHDLSGADDVSLADVGVAAQGGFQLPGMEGHWAREEEVYFGLCWRWRNIPKVTIAEVQGKFSAGSVTQNCNTAPVSLRGPVVLITIKPDCFLG